MNNSTKPQENKKTIYERIFYNNKLILVLSFVLAIVLWAVVKVNYSENATRVITDVRVTLDASLAAENDFVPFYDSDMLTVDVEVSGKPFDINNYSLSREDITIEATSGYIDAAGYKALTLTPVTESGVNVVKITPSTVTVYFDRMRSAQVNVEARLTNEADTLVGEGFSVGQIAASESTATVSGPASVVDNLSKVYFEATVPDEQLPLSQTTEVTARISYALDKERDSRFLVCENVGTDANPATVTIPVYQVSLVPTAVKFVNQPPAFDDEPPRFTITPAQVEISYTPGEEDYTSFTVGTIDFAKLKNGVNRFRMTADETGAALLRNSADNEFNVLVDLRGMQSKTLDATGSKVVFLNQAGDKKYNAGLTAEDLGSVQIIGPAASLEKLTADQLQIEINVSSLKTETTVWQSVRVSNISIRAAGVDDCWVFGSYHTRVQVLNK